MNRVLQDLYWKYGGERVLARLAGVKYLDDSKKLVEGSLEIVEGGGQVGVRVAKGTDNIGTYTTKIKWGIQDIDVRPFDKGYWGKRVSQTDPRVDAFELKVNPSNESFYLPHPNGGYVQYENVVDVTVQDGKLIMDNSSIY